MPMEQKKSAVSIGNAAAAIAIVQGIVWIILSLMEIVMHFTAELSIFDQELSFAFKLIVLGGGQTVSSTGLLIISFIYLGLSLFWVSISIPVIVGNRKFQKTTKMQFSYQRWGVLTVLICIYDLIVVILLASDYSKCWWHYVCVAQGILFSVAARGFIFWVINLTFGILMIKNARSMSKKAKPGHGLQPVSGFEDARAPNTLINAAYEWNTETSGFYKPPPLGHPQNRPTFSNHPQPIDQFPKQGYPGGFGNPPQSIPPPSVPSYAYPQSLSSPNPDYSPPNSPQKTALKGEEPQNMMKFDRDNRY